MNANIIASNYTALDNFRLVGCTKPAEKVGHENKLLHPYIHIKVHTPTLHTKPKYNYGQHVIFGEACVCTCGKYVVVVYIYKAALK